MTVFSDSSAIAKTNAIVFSALQVFFYPSRQSGCICISNSLFIRLVIGIRLLITLGDKRQFTFF